VKSREAERWAREAAYQRHGAALIQHGLVKEQAQQARTVDNLTALHLASVNLGLAEQDLLDWNDDDR